MLLNGGRGRNTFKSMQSRMFDRMMLRRPITDSMRQTTHIPFVRTIRLPNGGHLADAPLTEGELFTLNQRINELAETEPDVSRQLLVDLQSAREGETQYVCKSVTAKINRQHGKGKTMLFAYLPVVDKERILQLTNGIGYEEVIRNKHGRTAFFATLPGEVKYGALRQWQKERDSSEARNCNAAPSRTDLRSVVLSNGVPMVGFGFVDNFLMIACGGALDTGFGIYMGTMLAAGFGNLFSNVVGLGLADYIEGISDRLGIPTPNLSVQQRAMRSVRMASLIGTAGGVTVGCLLGLVPLVMFPSLYDPMVNIEDVDHESVVMDVITSESHTLAFQPATS